MPLQRFTYGQLQRVIRDAYNRPYPVDARAASIRDSDGEARTRMGELVDATGNPMDLLTAIEQFVSRSINRSVARNPIFTDTIAYLRSCLIGPAVSEANPAAMEYHRIFPGLALHVGGHTVYGGSGASGYSGQDFPDVETLQWFVDHLAPNLRAVTGGVNEGGGDWSGGYSILTEPAAVVPFTGQAALPDYMGRTLERFANMGGQAGAAVANAPRPITSDTSQIRLFHPEGTRDYVVTVGSDVVYVSQAESAATNQLGRWRQSLRNGQLAQQLADTLEYSDFPYEVQNGTIVRIQGR